MVPLQLRDLHFGFVKLRQNSKIPFEKEWQKNPYNYDDIAAWYAKGNNYGVICGLGNLIVIDADSKILSDVILDKFPETFTVRTTKGFHFYFLSKTRKKKIIFSKDNEHLGELISWGGQVVAPLCFHPSGTRYEIERDIPIRSI